MGWRRLLFGATMLTLPAVAEARTVNGLCAGAGANLRIASGTRGQIVTEAFGESRPLVPTADGVREPQNRRVEIVLR